MNTAKSVVRSFFRQKRKMFVKQNHDALTDHFYSKYSSAIADLIDQNNLCSSNNKKDVNIGAFYPIKNELNCLSIIKNLQLIATGYSFSLPTISPGSRVLTFREYRGDTDLVEGSFKIPQPSENAPIVYPDVLLVPMLCFNQEKHRLGYGGGFYDTTIQSLKEKKPSLLTIGVAFDIQESEDLPFEDHDVQLDYILTENRLLH